MNASAADLVAQKSSVLAAVVKEKTTKALDYRRNLAFLLYGGFYDGMAQEFLFNGVFPILFGEGGGFITAAKKVLFDMLVMSPCLCLPMAYIIKAIVYRQSVSDGVQSYIYDVKNKSLLKKFWLVWFPVQCLTFTVVPTQFRIAFMSCFSFFWLILLSIIAGGDRTTIESSIISQDL